MQMSNINTHINMFTSVGDAIENVKSQLLNKFRFWMAKDN